MKNVFSAIATIVVFALISSCHKNDRATKEAPQSERPTQRFPVSAREEKQFHVFYVTWTEWGRTSRNCASGWGLCKAVSCWFCCTNDKDEIVDCKDGARLRNTGKVVLDTGSGRGYMLVMLEPAVAIQADAIKGARPFYVDQDIPIDGIVIQKGKYGFEAAIGSHGGYRVSVIRK